ncbi:RNA polymerase beta subunit [Shewanella phage FishSpeaker]|nr:RNA polymerase beta subunit [Shewanella phage FishSpeaker]
MKIKPTVNNLHPATQGVNSNLSGDNSQKSAGRSYMAGNMIPKSVVCTGNDEPLIISGFEPQYGKFTRSIKAPSNMTVEAIFYVGDAENGRDEMGEWETIYVIFKNEELNKYDILYLYKYHSQNSYIAWEYIYDKEMMRRLKVGATYRKGEVFARSPRVTKDGSWHFATKTLAAAMSSHMTEEDGIVVYEHYAREKLGCTFKHERKFGWKDDEYIPVMCYGTPENPRPFPERGERVRSDGVVMAFRKRTPGMALSTLTKKALREVDYNNDLLFRVNSLDCEVVSIEVLSDRIKNSANNRRNEYIEQDHTKILSMYERQANNFNLEIIYWYEEKLRRSSGEVDITHDLNRFIVYAYQNYTNDPNKRGEGGVNKLRRRIKLTPIEDWYVHITLRERVKGKVRFKLSGLNGDKGIIVQIRPSEEAPTYSDGTRADICINNTPAFRRQIYSMLVTSAINFINMKEHKIVIGLYQQDKIEEAYEHLITFYETVSPEFAAICRNVHCTDEYKREHVEHVANNFIQVQIRSDSEFHGAGIVRRLMKQYSHKPEQVTFVNSLGERVKSEYPIMITNLYYLLLDKFGNDASSLALPKRNIFGYPSNLNESDKYAGFQREVLNRNMGEAEATLQYTQRGPEEVVKQLALGYSAECQTKVVKSLIRADDPFDIDRILKREDFLSNSAVQMAKGMLSDQGYRLRHKTSKDAYVPPIDINLE